MVRALTPEAEAERRRKISETMQGNKNALKHGRRSEQLKEVKPVKCSTCPFAESCPFRADGDAICSLRPEFMSLAESLGGGRFYEHGVLCQFLNTIVQINSVRYTRGVYLEQEEELGLDPEVTSLSRTIFDQVGRLSRLLGFDRPDPHILIDQRRQSVEVNVREMPDEDFTKVLEALAQLRQLGQGEVVERILNGDIIDSDSL